MYALRAQAPAQFTDPPAPQGLSAVYRVLSPADRSTGHDAHAGVPVGGTNTGVRTPVGVGLPKSPNGAPPASSMPLGGAPLVSEPETRNTEHETLKPKAGTPNPNP